MSNESRLDRHKEMYREEAFELLNELETSLLELETTPSDIEVISRVFRALHTIKGSGAMFGFDDIAAFVHDIENVFELVRNGRLGITKDLIDLTLSARDHIRHMLEASAPGSSEVVDHNEEVRLLGAIRQYLPQQPAPVMRAEALAAPEPMAASAALLGTAAKAALADAVTYRIFFKPPSDIFLRGMNPQHIIQDLKALGYCHVVAHLGAVPMLDAMDPEQCYTYWDFILTTDRGQDAIHDVFMFIEEDSELRIDVIDEGGMLTEGADYKRVGEILIDRGTITRDDLEKVVGDRKRIGEVLVESGLVAPRDIESALTEQAAVKDVRSQRQAMDQAATIRVASEKLDRLVDLVGELVTVQARLSQTASKSADPTLVSIAEEVERLSADLHDMTMSVRMVPIGTTFTKFRRLVRDLSEGLGREINLVTSGGETELDKNVIERLNDPLVHLIRNCVDHGIEPPGVREAAGKTRMGTVLLSAMHSGSDVVVSITDDGAGLNADAIRHKAVEKGIVHHEADLTEHEVFNLIFAAGFSTAEKVTGVSGRGVGMDVVKRSIEALRGSVDVTSTRGKGTTIKLRIPLTLAIIEGLLVRIDRAFYVLPLSSVEECVELSVNDRQKTHGRDLVHVRGELVPYIPLRDKFGITTERPMREQVAIVQQDGHRVGFVVDQVMGEHQTVIKSLSKVYKKVSGISGATILGDGTVALILDAPRLIADAVVEEASSL